MALRHLVLGFLYEERERTPHAETSLPLVVSLTSYHPRNWLSNYREIPYSCCVQNVKYRECRLSDSHTVMKGVNSFLSQISIFC